MDYTIKTYNPGIKPCMELGHTEHHRQWAEVKAMDTIKGGASFYILLVGNNAGRPQKEPLKNCVKITTDNRSLYGIAQVLFMSDYYYQYMRGSCQQFIVIEDIHRAFKGVDWARYSRVIEKASNQLTSANAVIKGLQSQLILAKQLKKAIARATAKELNRQFKNEIS